LDGLLPLVLVVDLIAQHDPADANQRRRHEDQP
jgi:hypothetical protein